MRSKLNAVKPIHAVALSVLLVAAILGLALAYDCDCDCICNNRCGVTDLPHFMIYMGPADVDIHCSTGTHWFFYYWPRKCTYNIKNEHGRYECRDCGISCVSHARDLIHECGHDINCGKQYIECPDW